MERNRYNIIILILLVSIFANPASPFPVNNQISQTDSLLYQLASSQNELEKANVLLELSAYYINKDNSNGIRYAQEVLLLSQKNKYYSNEIRAELLLSRFYIDKGEYLEADSHLQVAINRNGSVKDSSLTAELFSTKALLYIHISENDKAADYCYQALRIYDQTNDKNGQAKILNIIAAIYSSQKKYDKALEYSLRCLAIKRQLSDTNSVAGDLSNIASSHMSQGNFDQAEIYLLQAIEINSKSQQKNWLAINYHQLASCYYKQEKYEESRTFLQQSLILYRELDNKLNETRLLNLLAEIYFEQKEYSKARKYFNSSLLIAKEYSFLAEKSSSYGGLYKLEKLKNNYQLALDYYTKYQSAIDSVERSESLSNLASLEIQYKLEKKQNELELEKQKNIAREQEKNLYIIILAISFLSTLVFIVLLVLRYRIKSRYSKIKEQKLEDEIEYKNKELTTNVMSLMKKNEMLSEITDKLIEVESQAVKEETKTALKRIAIDIEKSTQEKIWEEFEVRFKQVHSDFYEKLISQFPDLSPNEQRLCAFLRLNLSSKEIAAITGKNSRSIEMARFRLRKKLGISSQDINLINFISKI